MQIEAPYVFDCDNAIVLYTMQMNRASSRREGRVSWDILIWLFDCSWKVEHIVRKPSGLACLYSS